MNRIFVNETISKIGEKVKVSGWVHVRRDHGKIIFIDLRDRSGLLQVVFAGNEDLRQKADQLRSEWVVSIEGTVKERPENLKNPKIETGGIELAAEELEVLNESKTPPFSPYGRSPEGGEIGEKDKVNEELRMEYRYLDLRDPKMQKNLIKRSEILRFLNNYFKEHGFLEIETPNLTKGTPEGAREFVVPSRKHPGKFYVLPQSPQQFKQLLMVAGLERYFQIARCFRDEDSRGDRQPEFTQLDVEMSFIEEGDVLELIEGMMIKLIETVFPEKKLSKKPFPQLNYDEVMEKYQTDKPDLREDKNNPDELAFAWVVNMPLLEYSKTDKKWVSSHHPFTAPSDLSAESLLKAEALAKEGVSPQPPAETVIEVKADFSSKRQQALQTRRKKREDHLVKIIALVGQKGKVSNKDVRDALRVSQSTASDYLHALVKSGKIKKEGKAKATKYYL